jgi:predicted metal-binding membrane protein
MTARDRFVQGSSAVLLLSGLANPPFRGPMLAAAAGLAASLVFDFHVYLPLLCGSEANGLSAADMIARLQLLLAINAPMAMALAWLAMLVAMMTPLIALPLSHVRNSSLASRRWRAAATFLLGYFGCWFLAAVPLLATALMLRVMAGGATAVFVAAIALALLWSASPLQQAAQNRAHRLRRIGLFGFTADRDCIVYGAALGCWCIASCWAWMLVPLFASDGHVLAMLAVSAIVMAERLRGPGPARWRVPEVLVLAICWLRHSAIPGRRESAGGHV